MIKAVGFDLDGTFYPHFKMILNSVPFFLTHPRTSLDFINVRRAARGLAPSDDFRKVQAEILAKRRKIGLQDALQRIDRYFYKEWEKVISRIPIYADLVPFLEELKAKKIKLAVMSDFPPDQKLKDMNLTKYFDFAFCSEEAGVLKPHPATFKLLTSRFELSGSEVLYVGNSRKNDIMGAKAAGLKTAYLGRKSCPGADIVFHSYSNLLRQLSSFIV